MHYWDTSALVKLYVSEPDSPVFAAHLSSTGPFVTSELARWEIFRVLARKEADGAILPGAATPIFAKFLADVAAGAISLVPLDQTVETRFRQLVSRLHQLKPPLVIRTLDAIHLAAADLHGAAEFVATDGALRQSATALGLKLYP